MSHRRSPAFPCSQKPKEAGRRQQAGTRPPGARLAASASRLGTIRAGRTFFRERSEFRVFRVRRNQKMEVFMPALIMWLLGVPITVIILLYLLF
jgi:hypothetical protein